MSGVHDKSVDRQRLQAFISELSDFAQTAEEALAEIETDPEGNKGMFSMFSERMFAIRGTTQQLGFPRIAEIAGLGEEIALKAVHADTRAQVRKCVGTLWDALTSVKYMLINFDKETADEQDILVNRLQTTLKALGGARPTVSEDEIEAMLNDR